jgi:hypothetical protein
MENLFEVINVSEGNEIRLLIGIRLKIAGYESICPVSRICKSPGELSKTLEQLNANLERLHSEALSIFRGEKEAHEQTLSPDMPPDEIWRVLSDTGDDGSFFDLFNQLDEEKRKEVAEYVLSQCNVFTGRGAVFSSRYNSETALLEDE